jgi:hypothetical protein
VAAETAWLASAAHRGDRHPPRCPAQAAPARALEWELPLEELRALVAGVAAGGSQRAATRSPSIIVSHGLVWRLKVVAKPAASDLHPPPQLPAAPTRPVQLGLFLMNSFELAVPTPPEACTLTGHSYRLEAARNGGGRPLRKDGTQPDNAKPNQGVGTASFFPALPSGSVDDPALAPFVHAGPGGAKMLRLRAEGLRLD